MDRAAPPNHRPALNNKEPRINILNLYYTLTEKFSLSFLLLLSSLVLQLIWVANSYGQVAPSQSGKALQVSQIGELAAPDLELLAQIHQGVAGLRSSGVVTQICLVTTQIRHADQGLRLASEMLSRASRNTSKALSIIHDLDAQAAVARDLFNLDTESAQAEITGRLRMLRARNLMESVLFSQITQAQSSASQDLAQLQPFATRCQEIR